MDKATKLIDNYIAHMVRRKDYYFKIKTKEAQEIFSRYDHQHILLLDLKAHLDNGDISR